MNENKPWLLSEKEKIFNLINGLSKYEADLNPRYYKESFKLYAKIRRGGFYFDEINPRTFKTSEEFKKFLFDKLKHLYLTSDIHTAKKAANILINFDLEGA